MPKRQNFTAKQRREAYERARGRCEGCGARLEGMEWHLDHILPDALSGLPEADNGQCLCVPCHRCKTRDDVRRISKADRQRKYHETGRGRARKGRALEGRSFDKSLSRKFDGTVVRRGE